MTDPLSVDELEDVDLRDQFNNLMEAMQDITTFDPNREEGAYEALNQRIYQAVTEQPILARIVNEMDESLLSVACSNLNLDTSHHVIKSLIEAYPSALIGPPGDDWPIDMIVGHPRHCILMPWIASNYTWILDDELCQEFPPVFDLLQMYAQRHRTCCTATTLKQFLEAYPRALTQQHPNDDDNVLHKILFPNYAYRRIECEVGLFKWMAERCPSSNLSGTDSEGHTPLHLACMALAEHKGNDSSEICKYLIQKCPESIRMHTIQTYHYLPIHYLQHECGYQSVREITVCLLREYRESYDIRHPVFGQPPSSSPFIESIKPLLDEEIDLKETVASLKESSSSLTKAVACTNDQLMRSAFTVYDSWATSFINSTVDKLHLISTQLMDMCNEGRESED